MRVAYVIVSFAISVYVFLNTGIAWSSMVLLAGLLLPMVWASKQNRWALIVMVGALLLVQTYRAGSIGDFIWLAFFATWVCVGIILHRWLGASWPALFCVFSSFSYLFGKLTGSEFNPETTGFPYMLSGNLFVIMAILIAGWRGGLHVENTGAHRSGGLGYSGGYSPRFAVGDNCHQSHKEVDKIPKKMK